MRHEVHVVPGPPGVDLDVEGFHTADGDQGIYFRPESGGTLLVGSEDPECDDRDWVDDPDSFNRTVTRSHWEAQVYRLARRIPGLEVPSRMAGVVDLYDVSDDWIPVYDVSDLPGYYMAVGSSGNQFKNAPVAGHAMAELITACEAGRDHDADPGAGDVALYRRLARPRLLLPQPRGRHQQQLRSQRLTPPSATLLPFPGTELGTERRTRRG